MRQQRILIFMMLLLAWMIVPSICAYALIIEKRTEPTCTEWGYIEQHDNENNRIVMTELPPTGHSFGDWICDEALGNQERTCQVCGYVESRHYVSETVEHIPWIKLEGSMDGMNKKAKVTLACEFNSGTISFSTFAVLTTQGHSTLDLEKKNYTVRLYDNPQKDVKHKIVFPGWQEEHKYILKANMFDPTQARNLVGSRIWRSMLETRAELPARITMLPTLGAVDGFPVSLWINDEFHGLYTLNLHKDNDLFGMKTGEKVVLAICNANSCDEARLLIPPVFEEYGVSDWEFEFSGLKDDSWAKDGFSEFVLFLNSSDDTAFRAHLSDYLDVDAAIDYLILLYTLGLQNSGTKDLIMLNYGTVWIPSAYDLDEAFGRGETGFLDPMTDFLPHHNQGVWQSGTGSVLWDRLLQNFAPEIKSRYFSLRANALSTETLREKVSVFINGIPDLLYRWDQELYPERPSTYTEGILQINRWIDLRMPVLDQMIGGF